MLTQHKDNIVSFLSLLFISPILATWILFRARNKQLLVFGATLLMAVLGALFTYMEGTDGHSHLVDSIRSYSDMGFTEFIQESWNILTFSPTLKGNDLYLHFLKFWSNSILGIPKSLHFFAGLILGYIIVKSILLLTSSGNNKLSLRNGILFLVVLITVHSAYSLNAIRIGTGMWLLFYASLAYQKTKDRKYILLLLLSFQIHFAYGVIMIPVLAAMYLKKFKLLVVALFVVSFVLGGQTGEFYKQYLPQTKITERKADGYFLDDNALDEKIEVRAQKVQQLNFYAAFGPLLFEYGIMLILVIYIPVFLRVKNFDLFVFLFSSAYLLHTVANFSSYIPSLRGRCIQNASVFMIGGVIILFVKGFFAKPIKPFNPKLLKIINTCFFVMCFPFLLRNLSDFISMYELFYLGCPLASFLMEDDISIKTFITTFWL